MSKRKVSEDERSWMDVSPIKAAGYLKGTVYPAPKARLIHEARRNRADDDVMALLEAMEDREYMDAKEVEDELEAAAGRRQGRA